MASDTRPSNDLEQILDAKFVARLGLGLLLVGLVFLFRWSLVQGWIGPQARVVIGAAVSAGLLGTGLALRERHTTFARLLQGGGLAGLYVSAFAAHRLYELVDAGTGLIQLVVISAGAIVLAVRQDDETLAMVGVAGGLAAPLLIDAVPAFPGDFGFIAAVVGVGAAVYYQRGWNAVFAVTAAGLALLIGPRIVELEFFGGSPGARADLQLGLLVAAVALWLVPAGRAVVRRTDDSTLAAVTGAAVPVLVYLGSLSLWTRSGDPTSITSAWALGGIVAAAFLVAASIGLRRLALDQLAAVQYLPAAGLVAVAALVALDGPTLLVAIVIEATTLVIMGRRAEQPWLEGAGHLALAGSAFAAAATALEHPTIGTPFANRQAVSQFAVIIGAATVALTAHLEKAPAARSLARIYGVVAHGGMLVWLASELSRVEGGGAITTGAWGAYGAAILAVGIMANLRGVRGVGLATVGVALGKLLLVDLATASTGWKIVLFMGFGIVLLGVGFWLAQRAEPEAPASKPSARPPAASGDTTTPGPTPPETGAPTIETAFRGD